MDEKKNIAKILGEPVIESLSENTLRIRRNLIVIAAIGIFLKLYHIEVSESTFFGLSFKNLTQQTIMSCIGFITLYQLAHFIIEIIDHTFWLRLKITGNRVRHVTTGKSASEYGDYPDDPRQSSLYNWWIERARQIKSYTMIEDEISKIKTKQQEIMHFLESNKDNLSEPNVTNKIRNDLPNIYQNLSSLNSKIEQANKILSSRRIVASLYRFDKWFWLYNKYQIFKWLLVEISFPIVIGVYSLFLAFNLCQYLNQIHL